MRTDALMALRQCGSVSSHLVLCDTYGGCVELDPRVLAANPLIWHELDTGVHRSVERGTLRTEAEAWISWAASTVERLDPLHTPPRLPDIPEPQADDLRPFLGHWSPYSP